MCETLAWDSAPNCLCYLIYLQAEAIQNDSIPSSCCIGKWIDKLYCPWMGKCSFMTILWCFWPLTLGWGWQLSEDFWGHLQWRRCWSTPGRRAGAVSFGRWDVVSSLCLVETLLKHSRDLTWLFRLPGEKGWVSQSSRFPLSMVSKQHFFITLCFYRNGRHFRREIPFVHWKILTWHLLYSRRGGLRAPLGLLCVPWSVCLS